MLEYRNSLRFCPNTTAQNLKFSMRDFFSKCDLMRSFIFCAEYEKIWVRINLEADILRFFQNKYSEKFPKFRRKAPVFKLLFNEIEP